jgi:hypothetical protein
MQKVVGSSPIIRSKKPANSRVVLTLVITENETLSQKRPPNVRDHAHSRSTIP